MLFVNKITRFEREKSDKIRMKVFFLSYFEKNTGTNNPQIAIVKVYELTYKPDTAIEVVKYWEICEIIPMMLKGVFSPIAENIKMYKSSFGFFIIFIYNNR